MQGIFINHRRPTSKKEVRESIADLMIGPGRVRLEATSLHGNEYDGPIAGAPDGKYSFVGPDPYKSRKFYGTIIKSGATIKVN